MTLAVEDIVNMSLDAIGWPGHIAWIYEGSPAARVALEIYGTVRDTLLEQGDWPFAMAEVLLVTNGQTPPSSWSFEYAYPSDCLRMRYVRPGPLTGGTINYDPQPQLFRPYFDIRTAPPARAILSNLSSAVLIYNAKVTNPASWDAGFTSALVSALAAKMAFMLPQSADTAKAAIGLATRDRADAMTVDDLSAPRIGMDSAVAQPVQQGAR